MKKTLHGLGKQTEITQIKFLLLFVILIVYLTLIVVQSELRKF